MKNNKSIEDYMRELDRLEVAGELDDDEPAFQGHTLNLTKWEAYQHIKALWKGCYPQVSISKRYEVTASHIPPNKMRLSALPYPS